MHKPNSDSITNTEGWRSINWRKAERYVFKLQKRIYAASRCGDVKRVRKLQKTLMRSWSNKVLAVRRVTQDNQGRKTLLSGWNQITIPSSPFRPCKAIESNWQVKTHT